MGKLRVRGDISEGAQANLRPVTVSEGLPDPDVLHEELQGYLDILIGRARVPNITYENSLMLMELADTYYTRGQEIKFRLHALERRKEVRSTRDSQDPYYKFRTGELEDFLEACKRSVETGSRRLSALQYELDKSIRGLNSLGG
jgi:hypothetical protein